MQRIDHSNNILVGNQSCHPSQVGLPHGGLCSVNELGSGVKSLRSIQDKNFICLQMIQKGLVLDMWTINPYDLISIRNLDSLRKCTLHAVGIIPDRVLK